MQQGLVTVVLPIYNVEKYLDRSVESVLNQTYKNLEVILVDDGSTDSCNLKCEEWGKRDQRIKIIHKKNEGLGEARNTGIEYATGEYICFFDSDDYVDCQIIEKAYNSARSNNADIVLWGVNEVSASGEIKSSFVPQMPKKTYSGEEIQTIILPELITPDPQTGKRSYLRMSAWACMFSMKVISTYKWKFFSERQFISEDVISLLYLYKYITKVAIIPECLYFYCENEHSLSHIYNKDRFDKIKFFYNKCQHVCDDLGYNQDVKDRMGFWYYSSVIGALKILISSGEKKSRCLENITEIICDEQFHLVIKQLKFNKEPLSRKVLFFAVKNRKSLLVYLLLKLRIRMSRV